MVASFKLPVSGWVAAACGAVILALAGCSPKSPETTAPDAGSSTSATKTSAAPHASLLLRVRFAGTAQLMAETNVTYLTNIAALPETAALGQRLVERMATLPGRLITSGSTNTALATNLTPIFSRLLQQGFALELHGDSNGVNAMILSAPATALAPDQLRDALGGGVGDRNSVLSTNGWTIWTVGARTSHPPSLPAPPAVLAVDLASTLLPNPIRQSVYGGFERFSFTAVPTPSGFMIGGQAHYASDLPQLSGPVVVPTNLVTEAAVSFSMIRNPGAWLAANSPIRRLLPEPVPDIAWFWGCTAPNQVFFAIPFPGTNEFTQSFGPLLVTNLSKLADITKSGPVVLNTNLLGIEWRSVPFAGPRLALKPTSAGCYLVAETFPAADVGMGLTPALLFKTEGTTNTVLFDWEFTATRVDTWFRVGQLALYMAGNRQLAGLAASTKWLQALVKNLPGGGNTATEITQTGPRELALHRLASVGFTGIELYWLANWLESENFPAANFLAPDSPPVTAPEPESSPSTQ